MQKRLRAYSHALAWACGPVGDGSRAFDSQSLQVRLRATRMTAAESAIIDADAEAVWSAAAGNARGEVVSFNCAAGPAASLIERGSFRPIFLSRIGKARRRRAPTATGRCGGGRAAAGSHSFHVCDGGCSLICPIVPRRLAPRSTPPENGFRRSGRGNRRAGGP